MAEVKETVLIEIDISKPEAEKQIDSLTKSISELNDENKELLAANKALEQQGQKNSKQHLDNSRQIEVNKQKIAENTASRKGLIQTIVAEDNSIKALSVRNRELINQRNLINTSTEEGRAKIARINNEIDKNNIAITKNSSALEKQRFNIGNYASALDRVIPGLGTFITQMQQATVAAKAFSAAQLGLIFGGIALAIAPVVSFLTSTGEGVDLVEREMEGLRAVIKRVRDEANQLGKSEVGLVGLLKESALAIGNTLIPGLNVLVTKYNQLAEAGRQYADTIDAIKDAEQVYGIQAERTENQIKTLILEAKNRTLSEDERIKKLDQVLTLEAQLQTQREDFAKQELSATIEANRARLESFGIIQKAEETQAQFAENNIENIRAVDEALANSLIESLLKLEQAAGSSIAIQEKAQNQRDTLLDKQEEREKKATEDRQKRLEKEAADALAQLERDQEFAHEQFEEEQRIRDERVAANDAAIAKIIAAGERLKAAEKKNAEEVKKINEKAAKDKEQLQQQALATASMVFGRNRAASSGITLIDTYLSAQKAYASQLIPGDPTSLIRAGLAAALSTIQGLARVALINGVQFALGGVIKRFAGGGVANTGGVLSGPSHARGGIPFSVGGRVGFEAEGGETIINRRSSQMFRNQLSAINQAGGGVAFANGGVVGSEVRMAGQRVENQLAFNDVFDRIQTVLVLEDFERKQAEVDTGRTRSVVVTQ